MVLGNFLKLYCFKQYTWHNPLAVWLQILLLLNHKVLCLFGLMLMYHDSSAGIPRCFKKESVPIDTYFWEPTSMCRISRKFEGLYMNRIWEYYFWTEVMLWPLSLTIVVIKVYSNDTCIAKCGWGFEAGHFMKERAVSNIAQELLFWSLIKRAIQKDLYIKITTLYFP